ncbi:MAG: hypothetical protein KJ645_03035 [Planctomycetes bacterium]|nr:hypothetical protein [Planctomycetota bacterium]
MLSYDIPDSRIGKDVQELTGKAGKVVFYSVDGKDKDAPGLQQRYDLTKSGAVLADEFGNPLKSGLKDSDEIADAYYELDDLMAERYQAWKKAIKKGRLLLEQGNYPEAAGVLKVFAFATGTDQAKDGKMLFDQVAQVARDEYNALVTDSKNMEMDKKTRNTLIAALSAFIEKWPKTPAAFSAEKLKQELLSANTIAMQITDRVRSSK